MVSSSGANPALGFGNRKIIEFSGGGHWIEGIGNHQGLLAEAWPNVSMYEVRQDCMSHLDTIRVVDGQASSNPAGTCQPIVMNIVGDRSGSTPFLIHPNPTINSVNITPLDDVIVYRASVFNNVGALLKEVSASQLSHLVLDVEELPAGSYMIRANTSRGMFVHPFVKL